MSNNIENLKKRLIYRAQYRGTREMDKLIGSFVKRYINDLNENNLKELENFLDIDDDTLYKIYNKELDTKNFKEKNIFKLFINYIFE